MQTQKRLPSTVLRLSVIAGLAFLPFVSACSNADEATAVGACQALAAGDWDRVETALAELDELDAENDLEALRSDLEGVRRAATIAPDNEMASLSLIGPESAVRETEQHFDGAWSTCVQVDDEMPPLTSDEAQRVWDDIGVNLYRLFAD